MRRTVGFTLLLVVLALAVGSVVAIATFPSKDELQRMSFESLGLDPRLLDLPFVKEIVDQTSGQVQDRVVDKARTSALEGAGVALVIVVVGATLIELDRRRRPGEPAPPPPVAGPPPGPAPTVEAPADPAPPVEPHP